MVVLDWCIELSRQTMSGKEMTFFILILQVDYCLEKLSGIVLKVDWKVNDKCPSRSRIFLVDFECK